jgi:hypothetical protein
MSLAKDTAGLYNPIRAVFNKKYSVESIVRALNDHQVQLKKSNPAQACGWERGWNEHEQMQLQRFAGLSFAEKLAWIKEAHLVI